MSRSLILKLFKLRLFKSESSISLFNLIAAHNIILHYLPYINDALDIDLLLIFCTYII